MQANAAVIRLECRVRFISKFYHAVGILSLQLTHLDQNSELFLISRSLFRQGQLLRGVIQLFPKMHFILMVGVHLANLRQRIQRSLEFTLTQMALILAFHLSGTFKEFRKKVARSRQKAQCLFRFLRPATHGLPPGAS